MAMIPMQYIGPYGRRQNPARCEGVGEFYYLDVVPIPEGMIASLPAHDWRRADGLCQFQKLDGKICGSDKLVAGSQFCEIHHFEVFPQEDATKRGKSRKSR